MTTVNIGAANISKVQLTEQGSNPAAPAATKAYLYIKADGVYLINSAGTVVGPLVSASHNHAASAITSGQLALARGGTNADLSATGPGDLQQAAASAAVTIRKFKLDAIAAPGAANDTTQGYAVGSMWVDVANDIVYFCVDPTAGVALWKQMAVPGVTAKLYSTDIPDHTHPRAAESLVQTTNSSQTNASSVSAKTLRSFEPPSLSSRTAAHYAMMARAFS
jgi:hypothetical protein